MLHRFPAELGDIDEPDQPGLLHRIEPGASGEHFLPGPDAKIRACGGYPHVLHIDEIHCEFSNQHECEGWMTTLTT